MYVLTLLIFGVGYTLGACPGGWSHFGTSCYYFSSDELDWFSARDKCFTFSGGHLAEIETKAESDYLETITRPHHKGYWLGGYDEAEGQWAWVYSGKPFTYTDWHPGEPNNLNDEDCLHLFPPHNQQWNDFTCTNKQNYICETSYQV